MGIPGREQVMRNAERSFAKSDNGSDYNPNIEEQHRDEESYKEKRKEIYGE
jgi:hypothetical protein